MIGTNPKTWPHGVIWGHWGGVSKEMGHCRGEVTGICTCATSRVTSCGARTRLQPTQRAGQGWRSRGGARMDIRRTSIMSSQSGIKSGLARCLPRSAVSDTTKRKLACRKSSRLKGDLCA